MPLEGRGGVAAIAEVGCGGFELVECGGKAGRGEGLREEEIGAVEAAIVGKPATDTNFAAAADALLADAQGQGSNDFKIPLARRTLIASLRELTGK